MRDTNRMSLSTVQGWKLNAFRLGVAHEGCSRRIIGINSRYESSEQSILLPALTASAAPSVPISAAAAATPTPAEAATTAAAIGFWAGFVHVDGASAELRAVQCRDCLLSVFVIGHFNETKTTGAASVAIGQNADPVHLAIALENLP